MADCKCSLLPDVQDHNPKYCECRITNCDKCFVQHLGAKQLAERKLFTCVSIDDEKRIILLTNWNSSCGKWKDFMCHRIPLHDDIWVFVPGAEERLKHAVNLEAAYFMKTHLPEVEVSEVRGPLFVIHKTDVKDGSYFDLKHLYQAGMTSYDIAWLLNREGVTTTSLDA